MEENINALDEVNKGASMGMDAISFTMEKAEDAEYMTRDTGDNIEISLSTCTDDSKGRLVILARV